jgi:hypothetical protein
MPAGRRVQYDDLIAATIKLKVGSVLNVSPTRHKRRMARRIDHRKHKHMPKSGVGMVTDQNRADITIA